MPIRHDTRKQHPALVLGAEQQHHETRIVLLSGALARVPQFQVSEAGLATANHAWGTHAMAATSQVPHKDQRNMRDRTPGAILAVVQSPSMPRRTRTFCQNSSLDRARDHPTQTNRKRRRHTERNIRLAVSSARFQHCSGKGFLLTQALLQGASYEEPTSGISPRSEVCQVNDMASMRCPALTQAFDLSSLRCCGSSNNPLPVHVDLACVVK